MSGGTRKGAITAPHTRIIYDALCKAADAGEPCPNNLTLQRLSGLPTQKRVSAVISNLYKAGRIDTTYMPGWRIVKIIATGKTTAPPSAEYRSQLYGRIKVQTAKESIEEFEAKQTFGRAHRRRCQCSPMCKRVFRTEMVSEIIATECKEKRSHGAENQHRGREGRDRPLVCDQPRPPRPVGGGLNF